MSEAQISESQEHDPSAFPFTAAKAAVIAPVLAIVLSKAGGAIGDSMPDSRGLVLGFGGLSFLTMLAGALFAVIALAGIRKHGAKGLAGKGACGLMINCLLAVIFVTNFTAARDKAIAQKNEIAKYGELAEDFREEVRNELGGEGPDAEKSIQILDRMQERIHESSRNLTGDAQIMTKASAGFTGRIKEAVERYGELGAHFSIDATLDFSTVESESDLALRTKHVEDFLVGNAQLRDTMKNFAGVFREELEKAGMKGEKIDQVVAAVAKQSQSGYEFKVKIRDLDEALGKASLELLGMLEDRWGAWKYDQEQTGVDFDDDTDAGKFNALIDKVNGVAEEQTVLQEAYEKKRDGR